MMLPELHEPLHLVLCEEICLVLYLLGPGSYNIYVCLTVNSSVYVVGIVLGMGTVC